MVAAIALAFFDFPDGMAATVGGEGTTDFDAFLEFPRGTAASVLFGFASVDELTTRGFASATAAAFIWASGFHLEIVEGPNGPGNR